VFHVKQRAGKESHVTAGYDFDSFADILPRGANCYGVSLAGDTVERFFRFYTVLAEWNRRMNLVSSRDMARCIEYHFLDSLKIAAAVSFGSINTLLDFGSGAGFPGIPLALAFPHIRVTLLDSRLKRCRFLETAVSSIPIENAVVIRSRIEALDSSYNESFDCVTTRATVDLAAFVRLAGRFVRRGGCLAAVKGDTVEEEMNALRATCDPDVFNILSTIPPACDGTRRGTVVVIGKA